MCGPQVRFCERGPGKPGPLLGDPGARSGARTTGREDPVSDGGAPPQHAEYFPTGELWQDESDSRYEHYRRYLFNGKEMDISTGLFHYGARHYDPRLGLWMSPDPILDRYMKGRPSFGVYQPRNLGLYTYTWNRPTTLQDPDGRFVPILIGIAVGVAMDVGVQYLEKRQAGEELTWENWDPWRTAISGGFGALGGAGAWGAAKLGTSIGHAVFYSGISGSAVSMAQTATMQRYRGEEFDPQEVAEAGAYGFMGGLVGGVVGVGASAALSRGAPASREAVLIGLGMRNANRGGLGGPLGGTGSATAKGASAGAAVTKGATDATGALAEEGYKRSAPGGDRPAPSETAGGGSSHGRPPTPPTGRPVRPEERRAVDSFERNYVP